MRLPLNIRDKQHGSRYTSVRWFTSAKQRNKCTRLLKSVLVYHKDREVKGNSERYAFLVRWGFSLFGFLLAHFVFQNTLSGLSFLVERRIRCRFQLCV